MALTGGVKFFEPSQNLGANGATAAASTGNSAAQYAIDRNATTYWRSVGSNDSTVETLEVDFASSMSINRILLLDHNWKQYTVKYDVAGTWTNFTSVIGLDGALGGGISETVFADSTSYYEFATVTTSKVQITITKTQTAGQDKYISQVICTTEIGTLQGFPSIPPVIDKNARAKKTLSGQWVVQKSLETASVTLNFKDYPSSSNYVADSDLMFTLFDRDTPFIVWLCGGRRGTNYFRYTLRGFRLKDAYTMQIVKPFKESYSHNIYTMQVNYSVDLEEHI